MMRGRIMRVVAENLRAGAQRQDAGGQLARHGEPGACLRWQERALQQQRMGKRHR